METILSQFNPIAFAAAFAGLTMFGLMFYFTQDRGEKRARSEVRKRLEINRAPGKDEPAESQQKQTPKAAARKIAQRTNDFYSANDPKNIRKFQMRLIQAGFLNENALGIFLAARVILAAVLGLFAVVAVLLFSDMSSTNKVVAILGAAAGGYFLPNFVLSRRIKRLQQENRSGFPDVMDLMIVAAEAGLTLEASIDRIAKEIEKTYPTLSKQLSLAAIEIRAGRPLDQSLRAFGERLGIDEVQGFATMIQQSKELGTSVSDALRVYSEEMRHKRMMMAEERAYALPAKLSIPVTAFILPVVIGIAVLPTAVRMMNQ
jgi:tight adherence protein C